MPCNRSFRKCSAASSRTRLPRPFEVSKLVYAQLHTQVKITISLVARNEVHKPCQKAGLDRDQQECFAIHLRKVEAWSFTIYLILINKLNYTDA